MWPCGSSGSPQRGQSGRPAATTLVARSTNARAVGPSIRILTRSGPSRSRHRCPRATTRRPRGPRRPRSPPGRPRRPRQAPSPRPGRPRRAARRAARRRSLAGSASAGTLSTPAIGQDVEQGVELLREDGHLRLLEDDADDVAALPGLEEERPAAGLADGAGDEPVGTIEGVDATGHDLTLRHLVGATRSSDAGPTAGTPHPLVRRDEVARIAARVVQPEDARRRAARSGRR